MINEYVMELSDLKCPTLVLENMYDYDSDHLDTAGKAVAMLRQCVRLDKRCEEHVYMICFDTQKSVIAVFEISHGTVAATLCERREILMRILICGASSYTIVHNHPSGDPHPSQQDHAACNLIKNASDIIGIPMLDFIIIGRNSHYSFYEESWI
ncbi:MAG: JAB domain-containing protein [Eubacterium sp.]|nr:JAB domain-containing protein [Eubacterium sp.]